MFPRESGHCFHHHIPNDVVVTNKFDINNPPISKGELIDPEGLRTAINYLKDLRYGDYVIFDCVAGYKN